MDVHAHTHTARKKWTHYFWEFLMLFLAVFCGFIAEYQLEHKIEKEKGKTYVHSMYEDLKADTATYSELLAAYKSKLSVLQNYYNCYDTIKRGLNSNLCFVKLLTNSSAFPDFLNTDRTLEQLKNAGGLRLLTRTDADSIISYDAKVRKHQQGERTDIQEMQNGLRNMYYEVLDFEGVYDLLVNRQTTDNDLLLKNNMPQVNKIFVTISRYTFMMGVQLENISSLKASAVRLIRYFEDKYGFNK